MKMFTYILSSNVYVPDTSGITMIQVDIFANSREEADVIIIQEFELGKWHVDNIEEN